MIIIVLALIAGIFSGLLNGFDYQFLPGILFAAAVVIGSFSRFAKVGLLRILAFVTLSVLANYLAVEAVIKLDDVAPEGAFGEMISGAAGGFVGSAILALALRFAYRMRLAAATVLPLLFAGAGCGAVFFLLPHPAIAYAVWQGAIAVVIAFVWARRGRGN